MLKKCTIVLLVAVVVIGLTMQLETEANAAFNVSFNFFCDNNCDPDVINYCPVTAASSLTMLASLNLNMMLAQRECEGEYFSIGCVIKGIKSANQFNTLLSAGITGVTLDYLWCINNGYQREPVPGEGTGHIELGGEVSVTKELTLDEINTQGKTEQTASIPLCDFQDAVDGKLENSCSKNNWFYDRSLGSDFLVSDIQGYLQVADDTGALYRIEFTATPPVEPGYCWDWEIDRIVKEK